MIALEIDTLLARYHLPPSALAARERLDRALGPAFEEALPVALARRGIDPDDGEICLREVHVPVQVRLGAGDGAIAVGWSDAAAEAIAAAVAAGGDDRVVRFASRRQALADFAAALARGDLRRAWAWAQLGLCRPDAGSSAAAAADGLARALAAAPEAIVPVLAAAARQGLLAGLAVRIPAGRWPELAARALAAAGGGAAIPALAGAGPSEHDTDRPEPDSRVARALARSHIATGAAEAIAADPSLRPAFAALALAEADPGVLRGPEPAGAVAAAAAGLAASRAAAPPSDAELRAANPEGSAWNQPDFARGAGPDPVERTDGEPEPARRAGPDPAGEDAAAAETAVPAEPAAVDSAESDAPRPVRVSAWTDWGGLLFLLAALEELGLPDEVAAHPLLAGRPFRWSLHRLALALVPMAEDDPAALAFAGLPPDAPPPSAGEPPPAPEEDELFAGLAARLAAEVATRLGETELAVPALLDRVCRRRAEIVADPGWFEVRLALDDVSTELRRARLDLDPGYLPSLGVVVRFVYG